MIALAIAWFLASAGVITWLLVCASALVNREGRWHRCRWCGLWVNELGDRAWYAPNGAERGDELLCEQCARSRSWSRARLTEGEHHD